MDVVAALLLLLGQPSADAAAIGPGTVSPQSGGIPTTPPPPRPTNPY